MFVNHIQILLNFSGTAKNAPKCQHKGVSWLQFIWYMGKTKLENFVNVFSVLTSTTCQPKLWIYSTSSNHL